VCEKGGGGGGGGGGCGCVGEEVRVEVKKVGGGGGGGRKSESVGKNGCLYPERRAAVLSYVVTEMKEDLFEDLLREYI
jgi:hypothetical protein